MSPLKQFLSQVEEALHKSLSEMEPYDETMQAGEDGIWYPSIEVEKRTFENVELMRTDSEGVLIEKSKNAVRLSLKIKQSDEIEKLLCLDFCRFLMQRAESFMILRRKAISGYDLTFLLTNKQVFRMDGHAKIVEFIIQMMQDIDKMINEMKISLNSRVSAVDEDYLKTLMA